MKRVSTLCAVALALILTMAPPPFAAGTTPPPPRLTPTRTPTAGFAQKPKVYQQSPAEHPERGLLRDPQGLRSVPGGGPRRDRPVRL